MACGLGRPQAVPQGIIPKHKKIMQELRQRTTPRTAHNFPNHTTHHTATTSPLQTTPCTPHRLKRTPLLLSKYHLPFQDWTPNLRAPNLISLIQLHLKLNPPFRSLTHLHITLPRNPPLLQSRPTNNQQMPPSAKESLPQTTHTPTGTHTPSPLQEQIPIIKPPTSKNPSTKQTKLMTRKDNSSTPTQPKLTPTTASKTSGSSKELKKKSTQPIYGTRGNSKIKAQSTETA